MTSLSVYFCSTRRAGTKQVKDYYAWMGLTRLTERHADQIAGVLSCYDRILVFGTLPTLCFAEGMTSYLYAHQIRISDYPRFAEPYRNQLRENGEQLATENGIAIETPWQEECAQRGLGPGGAG